MMPAIRATASASPLGRPSARSNATTSGVVRTRPAATARRTDTFLPETSTIRAAPSASTWVRPGRSVTGPPYRRPVAGRTGRPTPRRRPGSVPPVGSEVLARVAVVLARLLGAGHRHPGHGPGRQRRPTAALVQWPPGRRLLRHQRGLDAVEEPLQPAHQLRLGDPQLRLAGGGLLGERQRQPTQL